MEVSLKNNKTFINISSENQEVVNILNENLPRFTEMIDKEKINHFQVLLILTIKMVTSVKTKKRKNFNFAGQLNQKRKRILNQRLIKLVIIILM